MAAGFRIGFDAVNYLADLVDGPSTCATPGTPLCPVYRAEITVLIRPLVPNVHLVLLQITHIGIPCQEPDQLVDDGLEVELLGGKEGKAIREVETHLVSEYRERPCAGAVSLL